jgi:glycosyltransferase involved in cell wall biosynthesis
MKSFSNLRFHWQEIELIIVDNSPSINSCRDLFAEFQAQFSTSANVRYCLEQTPGLLSGRHRGLQEAKGEIIAYVDDDVVFTPDWIEGILECFSDPNVALCGGPTTPLFFASPPAWLSSFWCKHNEVLSYLPELSLTQTSYPCILEVEPQYVFGLNFIIRKKVLKEAKGFHPDCVPPEFQHFQADGETGLAKKIQELGYKTVYHHKIHLMHQIEANRLTVEYFENRYFYQGVCDSYSEIRKNGGHSPTQAVTLRSRNLPLPLKIARRLKNALLPKATRPECNESDTVKQRCNSAYKRGYNFHQECARRSPKLREWITKEDYFDFTYPELESYFELPPRNPTSN